MSAMKAALEAAGLTATVPVRFFMWDEKLDDIRECTEGEFEEAEGEVEYVRHTIFANGVSQICLTKAPKG